MLICWDLAFPEAFRELIAKGAKIVIVPTFCTFTTLSISIVFFFPFVAVAHLADER